MPVAAEVARYLGAELDVQVACKIGAPGERELALGAVTANGGLFVNDDVLRDLGISDRVLGVLVEGTRQEARVYQQRFRGQRPVPRIAGRIVILVDDGLATGATMRAAVRSVRTGQPARVVVVAVPVGPADTLETLRSEADEVVCLVKPEPLVAVGLHYRDFTPTGDPEVQTLLAKGANHLRAA